MNLRQSIEAERNPEAQGVLIEKAKGKIQEFASESLREEYGKLGYGGLDLEKRVQALRWRISENGYETHLKITCNKWPKIQQEMFNSQLNCSNK